MKLTRSELFRNRNVRLLCQTSFEGRITGNDPVPMAIGMDDDVHEVWMSNAAALRSNVSSLNEQDGDHVCQRNLQIWPRCCSRPFRPRSVWK